MKRPILIILALLFTFVPHVFAQVEKGNLYGAVIDESAGALPGATVTLSGDFGATSAVTDGSGKYRFLNLDHGTYTLTLEMDGFATLTREVILTAGVNVDLTFVMSLSAIEETVTVTAETPVVDVRKMGTAVVVSRDELQDIPSSRDPWALLRTVPGVQLDRVNIAGSESGQQSGYQGKGSHHHNNTWTIDGIAITDMATWGASPGYYTYDTIDEINITTGGADITTPTGGVHMNIVTKRGTNKVQGSAAVNWTDDSLQSSNLPDELVGDPRLKGNDKADHIDNINDWSIDFGGPIWKDKVWGYGSYGRNVIEILRLTQSPDKTTLENWVGKLNVQATESDQFSLFYFLPSKTKIGRPTGVAGLIDSDEHLRDQGNAFPQHPHGLTKGEWNRVWSSNFISNVKFAYFSTGFTLGSREPDKDEIVDFVNQETRGGAVEAKFLRPQTTFRGDASYFVEGLGGTHEIKFGADWKKVGRESRNTTAGNKTQARINPAPDVSQARFYRDSLSGTDTWYTSFHVGDVFTRERMTFNVGLRFDHQTSKNKASAVTGNPMIPELLPGPSFAGGGQGIEWNDLSPRGVENGY